MSQSSEASDPRPSALFAWVLAARPKTLVAAVLPVLVGTLLARQILGEWRPWLGFCALGGALFLQLATNFFNDAIDARKGADTEERIGPRRATASGDASGCAVMGAGILCLLIACAFAIPLIGLCGWPILAIGIPSLFLCYAYTGGPFPLAYLGLGELFVILFFGIVAVWGTVFVHTGDWPLVGLIGGLQIGLLSSVLIEINNLRDIDQDRAANKKTLAVRWGAKPGTVLLALFLIGPYALGIYWWGAAGQQGMALWPLLALPLGIFLLVKVARTEPSPAYNRYLGLGALHFLLFTVLLAVGMLGTLPAE